MLYTESKLFPTDSYKFELASGGMIKFVKSKVGKSIIK